MAFLTEDHNALFFLQPVRKAHKTIKETGCVSKGWEQPARGKGTLGVPLVMAANSPGPTKAKYGSTVRAMCQEICMANKRDMWPRDKGDIYIRAINEVCNFDFWTPLN